MEAGARIANVVQDPADGVYASEATSAFGEPLAVATIPGLTIDAALL